MASTGWRPGLIPPKRRGLAGLLTTMAAVVAIVGSCGAVPPTTPLASRTPVPSTLSGAGTPTPASPASPGSADVAPEPSATPSPSASAEPWAAVTVSDIHRPARLEPTHSGLGGVARDTAFVLTSLDGQPAEALASRIVASPAIAFKVKTAGTSAVLTPTTRLAPATAYRISLQRPDGSTEAAWTARTASPLQVASSIPGADATGVPLDAGIEILFNQYGVTASALRSHFTISPATAGTFSVAGRSVAFAPTNPLKKSTLYTVTVRRGLPVDGTGEALAADYVLRFETAGKAASPVRVWFSSPLVDASTRERPAFAIGASVPDGSTTPRSLAVTVHRLPSMQAAMDAWRAVEASPEWTMVSQTEAVPTTRLPKVLGATVRLSDVPDGWGSWFALPKALPLGWYVVTERFGGIPRQSVLQVTNTAVYSLVSTTGTALWVNDLATGRAVSGATATIDGTRLAGATDGRGLLVAATPRPVASGSVASPTIVVTAGGRSTFRPVDSAGYCAKCDNAASAAAQTRPWWSVVTTDRYQYRSTDTVNAYGIIRRRSDGSVPASVSVAIWTESEAAQGGSPIVTSRATPDARGMYATHLKLAGLPTGSYRLLVDVGSTRVAEVWFTVAMIRKPAYTVALSTDHRAYIEGQPIHATAAAGFFEGTPVAGAEMTLALQDDATPNTAQVTTDTHGTAAGDVMATLNTEDQWSVRSVAVSPTMPEEADLTAEREIAVFRGSSYITVDGTASTTRVLVTGSVNAVALDHFDTQTTSIWDVNPRGAARPNTPVRVTGTAVVDKQVKTGSAYDFVTKRVTPTYRTTQTEVALPAAVVRTGANGSFRVSIRPVAGASTYHLFLRVTDPEGRTISTELWTGVTQAAAPSPDPWLENADAANLNNTYSVGDTVRVRLVGGNPRPTTQRYLFAVLQEGLRYATVGTSSTFRTTFSASGVPSITIFAARFNGVGYDAPTGGFQASTRLADHTVGVSIKPDRVRYEPGGTAKVTISTTGPDGKPTAATVFVQAVDEKLYAIGATRDPDLLWMLYEPLGDGAVGMAVSHRTPRQIIGPQGGDTMGGGNDSGRTDYRDWLVATTVVTDASGTASLEIPLADDITSWRVTATAVDGRLDLGSGTALLAVGLPFFADAIIAPEYLASDRPAITVRSFGNALHAADDVTFTVSSDTLPMAATVVHAKGFANATVALPALSVGSHRIRVAATTGTGSGALADTMTRTFTVVASRATATRMTWTVLSGSTPVQTGPGLTTVTLADAGRGRVIPVLQSLAEPDGTRGDGLLAWSLASRTLASAFGLTGSPAMPSGVLTDFTQNGGIALVPWGSTDLDATALAAMAREPQMDAANLAAVLEEAVSSDKSTRERRLLALAGLAALDEPVLGDVKAAAAQTDLTVEEQIDTALAAWFAGDEELAASLEHRVLAQHGRTFGGQVRIDAGPDADVTVATARLAIVAASLGDPLAAGMDAYVADHPSRATIVDLERALAARGWADRVPGAASTAAVVIDGQSRTVALDPSRPVELVLTPAQAASARIAPTGGSVLAIQRWEAPFEASRLDNSSGLSIGRTVEPAGTVNAARTVVVTMQVALGTSGAQGGWRVVDLAPSGLLPIAATRWVSDPTSEDGAALFLVPSRIDGQRVEFSVPFDPKRSGYTLRYIARVVTAGAYAWEPAVLQSITDPSAGDSVPASTITISSAPD